MRECCSYTYLRTYIAIYLFKQLSELEQCRVENLPKGLTQQQVILIRVLLVESPKLYPWTIALYLRVVLKWITATWIISHLGSFKVIILYWI